MSLQNYMPSKTITICSSAAFYQHVLDLASQLEKFGYKVKVPDTAIKMRENNDFEVDHYKTWYRNSNDYKIKTRLMKNHFEKIISGQAILVINETKRGIKGYIGGNTLMEMAIAFINHKPIYIFNDISEELFVKEEVYGLEPIFINGNLQNIKL
jgi:hypothetical protein